MSSVLQRSHTVVSTQDVSAPENSPPLRIVWRMVFSLTILHIGSVIGLYLTFTSAAWKTTLFGTAKRFVKTVILSRLSTLGINAGFHRLWSHKAYKAKLPLRIFLAFLVTMALQLDILWWARDHRTHHKYSETNSDPYNAKRGFFFSHIGWLMVRKHPDVIGKGKTIDISDLLADPIVTFQRKYYTVLSAFCCFVLPTAIPMMFWEESFINSFLICVPLRLVLTYHITFLVNSAAHMWGNRPYDNNIEPRENFLVNLGVIGEGFHNYHHTFSWDYAASEHGTYFNITTTFINAMVLIGLAYDTRTVPREMIQRRKERTGDKISLRKGSSKAKNAVYYVNT